MAYKHFNALSHNYMTFVVLVASNTEAWRAEPGCKEQSPPANFRNLSVQYPSCKTIFGSREAPNLRRELSCGTTSTVVVFEEKNSSSTVKYDCLDTSRRILSRFA